MKKIATILVIASMLVFSLAACEEDTSMDYEDNTAATMEDEVAVEADDTAGEGELQEGYVYDDLAPLVEFGLLGASGDKMVLIGYNSQAEAFYFDVDTAAGTAYVYAGSMVMTPEGVATITDMQTGTEVNYTVGDTTIIAEDGTEYDAMSLDAQETLERLQSFFDAL